MRLLVFLLMPIIASADEEMHTCNEVIEVNTERVVADKTWLSQSYETVTTREIIPDVMLVMKFEQQLEVTQTGHSVVI